MVLIKLRVGLLLHLRDVDAMLVVTNKIDDLVLYDKSFFMQGLLVGNRVDWGFPLLLDLARVFSKQD